MTEEDNFQLNISMVQLVTRSFSRQQRQFIKHLVNTPSLILNGSVKIESVVEANVIQQVKNANRTYLANIKVCIELFSVLTCLFCVRSSSALTFLLFSMFFISTYFFSPSEFFRPFFLPLDVDVLSMWHLSNGRKNLNTHNLRFHRAIAKNLEV